MNISIRFRALAFAMGIAALGPTAFTQGQTAAPGSILTIFDTDFAIPPQDDGMALMLALKSPELKILGITTVAGNDTMQRATSDALRTLELANRPDIPVYRGANRPLMHEASDWAKSIHGKWWSDEAPPMPPGGFPKLQAQKDSAVTFLIRAVHEHPKQISILALGPLTNLAMAIRLDPTFAQDVKSVAIMGGAVASLADGAGNCTPNAEFNFWVDPEAAWIVLHSGMPLVLSPLNVARKTSFAKQYYDQVVAANTPLTNLIKERMGPGFEKNPKRAGAMYDQLTVAALVDPTLVKAVDLYMEMDTEHGPDYGTSIAAPKRWEGGEQSVKVSVQYDIDFDRFIRMFIDRVTQK